MEHICISCHKSRSLTYCNRHPIIHGKVSKPGVCSRCVKRHFLSKENPPPQTVITKQVHHHHYYEIHHYYQLFPLNKLESIPESEEIPSSCAELPCDNSLPHIRNGVVQDQSPPPPVYLERKPNLLNGSLA